MKRDMDLVRRLLFYFEDKADFALVQPESIVIDGYDSRSIGYHIDIMYEAHPR